MKAAENVQAAGLRGKENVHLAAEAPEVAAAIARGDIEGARAAAKKYQDPKKRAAGDEYIRHYEEQKKEAIVKPDRTMSRPDQKKKPVGTITQQSFEKPKASSATVAQVDDVFGSVDTPATTPKPAEPTQASTEAAPKRPSQTKTASVSKPEVRPTV